MAVKLVAALLGFITAVWSYSWWNAWLLAPIAVVAAIATGIVVYLIIVALLSDLIGR